MLVIGILMAKVAGQHDISLVLIDIGLPILGMIVLILAAWTTNTSNVYLAGIDIVNVFNLKDDKPMAGVLLADYWIISKGKPQNWKPREGFYWIGIVAWLLGFILNIFVTQGLVLVQSIALSGAAYIILYKIFNKSGM